MLTPPPTLPANPSHRIPEALWSLFWLVIFFWLWIPAPLVAKILSLGAFALAAYSPTAFWILLALALPWFGKDPGGPKPYYILDMALMGLVICEGVKRAIAPVERRLTRLDPWISIFVVFSVFASQTGWWAIWPEYGLAPLNFMRRLFEHYATSEIFGLRASLGLGLAWSAYRIVRDAPWPPVLARRWIWALMAGLAVSLALGLADYFRLIPLEWWRPDNPDLKRFGYRRLMSLFGHSGWYAQYVAALTPFALTLGWFARRIAARMGWWALAGVAFFAQLLTFQRGGWLAIAAGAGAAGFAILVIEAACGRARRFVKPALISTATAIAMCTLLAVLVPDFRHRLGEMTIYTHRTQIWESALQMWWPKSFWGGAGFGYYYQTHIHAHQFGDPFFWVDKVTAHNLWIHVMVERGIATLALLVSIAVAMARRIWPGRLSAGAEGISPFDPALRAGVFGSITALLIYSIVQYIFYIRLIEILCWIWLGWSAWTAKAPAAQELNHHRWAAGAALLLMTALLVHENHWRYPPSYYVGGQWYRCAPGRVVIDLPAGERGLNLRLTSQNPTATPENPVGCHLFFKGKDGWDAYDSVNLTSPEEMWVDSLNFPSTLPPHSKLEIRISRTWRPLADYGLHWFHRPNVGVMWQLTEGAGMDVRHIYPACSGFEDDIENR